MWWTKMLGWGSVVCGAVLLSGCSTPEVRTTTPPRGDLTFYSEAESSATPKPSSSPQVPKPPLPPVPSPRSTKSMYTQPPVFTIDPQKQYTATLETAVGSIVIELDADTTPMTVNNFVFLSREKFYDGTIFHRTIKGFMIQGGDPEGTGTGGPGYKLADEPFSGEYARGTVAMANSGPNTNGSQFFIMHQDYALPKNYVIFGHVTSGIETVDKIAEAPVQPNAFGESSTPVTPVTVETVTIEEK